MKILTYFILGLTLHTFMNCSSSQQSSQAKSGGTSIKDSFVILSNDTKIHFSSCQEPKKPLQITNASAPKMRMNYPEQARNNGVQDNIIYEVLVSKEGELVEMNLLQGRHISLINEAKRILQLAEFNPSICNGDSVSTIFEAPFEFKLFDN